MQLSALWNSDPTPDEDFAPDRISQEASTSDVVSNGNFAVQLITTLGLQKQAMALQDGLNSVVDTVNSLLGEVSETNKVSCLYKRFLIIKF